jgi:hypothetical protein
MKRMRIIAKNSAIREPSRKGPIVVDGTGFADFAENDILRKS